MAKKKEKTLEEKLQEALVPENQWPYILPENWCWLQISKLYDVGSSKRIHKSDWIDKGIPFIRTRELVKLSETGYVDNDLFISELLYEELKAKYGVPKCGDILISGVGTIGVPYIVKGKKQFYFKDGNVIWLKPKVKINASYIFWLYKSQFVVNQIKAMSSGTTVDTYTITNANNTLLPIPPLLEQKRIVHRVESLFAKLDEAKEKIQQVLDGAEMRKAAILHKAFTGELTKTWRKENGISEDSWEVKKLSDCGNWYGGGTPSKTHPEYWEKGNILWITSKDMKSDYIEDSQQHINSYGVENSSAKYIEEHALICVMRSGILRHSFPVAVIKKPFTVNQDLKVLVPNKMINIEYLLFICKYKEQSILNSCMKNGTTVESINFDKLKNFSIMIPAEIEQIRIVNIIKKFLCRENDVLNKCNKFITSIATMKKSILAKAFRGELGTNNPTEDSAFNLLKEVLQDKS